MCANLVQVYGLHVMMNPGTSSRSVAVYVDAWGVKRLSSLAMRRWKAPIGQLRDSWYRIVKYCIYIICEQNRICIYSVSIYIYNLQYTIYIYIYTYYILYINPKLYKPQPLNHIYIYMTRLGLGVIGFIGFTNLRTELCTYSSTS